MESDYGFGMAVLPYGSPIEKTQAVVERMKKAAQEAAVDLGHPDLIAGVFAVAGGGEVRCNVLASQPSWVAKVQEAGIYLRCRRHLSQGQREACPAEVRCADPLPSPGLDDLTHRVFG